MSIRKRAKKYAKRNHYYKFSKIKKYLKLFDKYIEKLNSSVPKVNCPSCGSSSVDYEYEDSEYSFGKYMYCNYCGDSFEDTYGYIDILEEMSLISYFDTIELMQYGYEWKVDYKSYEWSKFCDEEMDKMINKLIR